jgi:hypothetical protein
MIKLTTIVIHIDPMMKTIITKLEIINNLFYLSESRQENWTIDRKKMVQA